MDRLAGETSPDQQSLGGLAVGFAVYAADVSDLRQWGIVAKYADCGYGDCVKTPS